MSNEEMLLRALNGEELPVTEFHPQTNKQAYLAYALGLITDVLNLPPPRTAEEALLKKYCINGALPELTNPAVAEDIRLFKEAINGNGEVVTGTCDIEGMESELEEVHALNDELEARLNGGDAAWSITDASYLFYRGSRADDLENILKKVKSPTTAFCMFSTFPGRETFDLSGVDFSSCKKFNFMFNMSEIKSIDMSSVDMSSADTHEGAVNIFAVCPNLEEVTGLAHNAKSSSPFVNMFDGSRKLKRITFSNDVVRGFGVNLYLPGASFEREGVIEMMNSLPVSDENKTITLSDNPCVTGTRKDGTACDVLTDEDKALIASKNYTLVV